MFAYVYESPIGRLTIQSDGYAIARLRIGTHTVARDAEPPAVLTEAADQLERYFAGELTAFDLPLSPQGTPFQRRVWTALLDIPYGETRSYGELASMIGDPGAARAVGAANGRNPIGIIVPCHRVIGADGSLTGYAGGIERKRALLQHERRFRAGRDLFSVVEDIQ